MAVVLQCGLWLSGRERSELAHRALTRLKHDRRSGALGAYLATYANRLLQAVGRVDPSLYEAVERTLQQGFLTRPPGTAWPGRTDDDWPATRDRIDKAIADSGEGAPADLDAWPRVIGAAPSFGLRVMATAHLRSRLESLIDKARQVLPTLPAERVPIAKSADRGDGLRTIQLCDLWRLRLAGPPGEADSSAARLREFFDTEGELLVEWEEGRRSASVATLRQVVRVGRALEESLAMLVGSEQRACRHPVLRVLFDKVDLDARSLQAQAAEQVRSADGELAQADAAETPENVS